MATFMELLDTSISNVSLPHIAGGLGTSYDESTWVLTSYLVANAIILPMSAWLSRVIRAQTLLHDLRCAVYRNLASLRASHPALEC
jgi:MFS transporter, DHA2 family, multidrug resistance protein